jgi:hypothetical protein
VTKDHQLLLVAQDLITQLVGFLSATVPPPRATVQAALDAATVKAQAIRAQVDPPLPPLVAPQIAPTA